MNKDRAKVLADQAELIRQLCMSQLATAQMANPTLHGMIHSVTLKAMKLRDDILAAAEEPKVEKAAPKKRGRPRKTTEE